jgi:HD-like signal output (HDOD) protein
VSVKEKVIDLIRNKATSLPTLPVIINNIIVKAKSDNTTPEDLAHFISNDQALSARVLKIANSPYYGLPRKIDSITRAIIIIGFREIISIALGSGIFKMLTPRDKDDLIDVNDLWKHSIGVGFASKQVGMVTGKSLEESTMLVGLLHDVGKILFLIYFLADYAEVLVKHQTEGAPLHLVEYELLEIDHAEMAYLLMKQWNFPDNICIPVRFHHNIDQCPAEHLTRALMVNAADYICHAAGIGSSANIAPDKNEAVFQAIGLTEEGLQGLIESSRASREEVDAFLEAMS